MLLDLRRAREASGGAQMDGIAPADAGSGASRRRRGDGTRVGSGRSQAVARSDGAALIPRPRRRAARFEGRGSWAGPRADDRCAADHLPRAHRRRVHRAVLPARRRPGLSPARRSGARLRRGDVLLRDRHRPGPAPGPYDDVDACRYARAFLVPEELLERPASSTSIVPPRRSASRHASCARRAGNATLRNECHGGHGARS